MKNPIYAFYDWYDRRPDAIRYVIIFCGVVVLFTPIIAFNKSWISFAMLVFWLGTRLWHVTKETPNNNENHP